MKPKRKPLPHSPLRQLASYLCRDREVQRTFTRALQGKPETFFNFNFKGTPTTLTHDHVAFEEQLAMRVWEWRER